MNLKYNVETITYDKTNEKVIIKGWCYNEKNEEYKIITKVNNKPIDVKVNYIYRADIAQAMHIKNSSHLGFVVSVPFPSDSKNLELCVQVNRLSQSILNSTKQNLEQYAIKKNIVCFLDKKYIENNCICVQGWAVSALNKKLKIYVCDMQGRTVDFSIKRISRADVLLSVLGEEDDRRNNCGFFIRIPTDPNKDYVLTVYDGKNKTRIKLTYKKIQILTMINEGHLMKGVAYFKKYGIRNLAKKVYQKILKPDISSYDYWLKLRTPDKHALDAQSELSYTFSYQPKISIIVPLYRTPERYLREMIESVQKQTYTNWELCLSDGSGKNFSLKPTISEFLGDKRIKYRNLNENRGISGNSNGALAIATGDFVTFLDHDDILPPHALYEIISVLNDDPSIDVLYTDEDKVDMDGKKHFSPNFKPDFSIDLLCSVNYICHLFVVKKSIVDEAGGFRKEYDGAQDYDFIFRCVEKAENIHHIPKVLYHWRSHMNSTAENPESKLYAFEAGIRAISDHYKRVGISANVEHGIRYGVYRSIYTLKEKPLVSVIIPNMDHVTDLDVCLRSFLDRSTYDNLEVIIVENNSKKPSTFNYYKQIQQEFPQVKVVYWDREFNYSAINNFGVKCSAGEYLLLLNNDTEMINEDCVAELLGYCMRDDVGIVGAKLYYEDDTVQHAGVIVGLGGVAGHAFVGLPKEECGYMVRAWEAQDMSAVTAACMMVKRSCYEEVGGFNEKFKVAFNDVDFCLQVRETGKLVVYNPYAELYHYESKSRGLEDTPEKIRRFNGEIARFKKAWPDILKNGDPYYNKNLTLDRHDYSLSQLL